MNTPTDWLNLTRWARGTVLLVAIAACDASGDRNETSPTPGDTTATPIVPSGTVPAPIVADAPLLAAACLRGDPAQGESWEVEGVGDSLDLTLEPLHELSPRDSARVAARLTRTVDALPPDTVVADFRGLPVAVRDAWRLVVSAGDTVFVAIAARQLPIESNPLAEHLFLLAEPGVRPGVKDALVAHWSTRSAGPEDELDSRDPIAAARTPTGGLHLLLVRESQEGPRVELLERRDGRWSIRWSGALPACP